MLVFCVFHDFLDSYILASMGENSPNLTCSIFIKIYIDSIYICSINGEHCYAILCDKHSSCTSISTEKKCTIFYTWNYAPNIIIIAV